MTSNVNEISYHFTPESALSFPVFLAFTVFAYAFNLFSPSLHSFTLQQ